MGERERLIEALRDEWLSNHAEHCTNVPPDGIHEGVCHWPMPDVLREALSDTPDQAQEGTIHDQP